MISPKGLLISASMLALFASGGTAFAAEKDDAASAGPTVETVIVTARRREENIERVPATVTAVNSEELRMQNIVTVADLATTTPSLSIATRFNSLNAYFSVRGLSAGVVTYFSDAPCCGGIASAPFLDISTVQVLNGPQGTLFGRSSAAGAVLIDPQHPIMNQFGGLADVTIGDFDRTQFTGVLNIPLITDHLAIRLAANFNHIDGYTNLIGQSATLDGVTNQQYRLGIEFKAGHFDNYTAIDYLNVDESGTGQVLAAYNPNFGLYNTPQSAGAAVFGAVCATAVAHGLAPDVASCETSRVSTLNGIGAALRAEQARQNAGGNAARNTYPSYDGTQLQNLEHHFSVVDITQYELGDLGPLGLSFRNIFSFDSFTADASETSDGIGGRGEEGAFANAFSSTFGSNNEMGSVLNAKLGPPQQTFTDEFQIHGNVADGLVISTLGVFYQDQITPANAVGTTNFYKLFSGVLSPNLGYLNAVGFIQHSENTETAWYGQATVDLSKVGIHGLSLTGGYRYTWDKTDLTTLNPVLTYPSGVYVPGVTPTASESKSAGYNYTFSAAEQWTDDLMTYVTVARAYIPGGVNQLGQAAAALPNYTSTYAAETVLEEEVGIKYDFKLQGIVGRLNLDLYNNDFSNIAETLTGLIGGTSVRYNENIAAATLRGVEVQGEIIPNRAWELRFGYSYNHAAYTRWTGSDPFNIAKPGNSICLPTSPAGTCYLNLTNNPFAFMPASQGHVTLTYHVPVDERLGQVSLSAVGYAQGREYYEATAARDLQLFPGGLNGVSQAPYGTLNLRVDWADVKHTGWNVAAFVDNVTDTLYASGKVPQLETLGFSVAIYAPPTMFGFELWRKF
jgi:iron complex outermembrane receptor protein